MTWIFARSALPALFVAALLAGSAAAQPGPGPADPGNGAGPMRGQGMYDAIDTNGDGRISRDEFQAHVQSMFAAMDQNHDGKVTKEEFLALHMGPGGGFGPGYQAMQTRKAARFDEIDADHDGTIDRNEFLAWEMARFDRADDARKGALTFQQFRRMDRW